MPRARSGTADCMLAIRVPRDLVARLDALVPRMSADVAAQLGTALGGRSAVARAALLLGVAQLERRHRRRSRSPR